MTAQQRHAYAWLRETSTVLRTRYKDLPKRLFWETEAPHKVRETVFDTLDAMDTTLRGLHYYSSPLALAVADTRLVRMCEKLDDIATTYGIKIA